MRVFDTRPGHEVRRLVFSPGGRFLAAGVWYLANRWEESGVYALALDRPGPPLRVAGWESGLTPAGFAPDGRTLYGHASPHDFLLGFDPATGEERSRDRLDTGDGSPVWGAAGPAGGRLVTVHQAFAVDDLRVAGWAADPAGGWRREWVVPHGVASAPDLAAAGDRVAQIAAPRPGSADYRLVVRDAASGAEVGGGAYPYRRLAAARIHPAGRQVVAARDAVLLVWDARVPGQPAVVRNDGRRAFTAAAYHPAGRHLFTTSNDGTVTVWDTDTWARVGRFAWDVGRLRAVAVSPDGLLAAAGSDRGRVVVWDVDL